MNKHTDEHGMAESNSCRNHMRSAPARPAKATSMPEYLILGELLAPPPVTPSVEAKFYSSISKLVGVETPDREAGSWLVDDKQDTS